MVAREPPPGNVGIGHTRWATHGRPSRDQRPPAHDRVGRGRPQRHHREPPRAARARWRRPGASSRRETDTEIVAHLIDEALLAGAPTLVAAVRKALAQVEGAYAIAVVSREAARPDRRREGRVAARHRPRRGRDLPRQRRPGAPRAHARGASSSRTARSPRSRSDGRQADQTSTARPSSARPRTITWTPPPAEKGGYKHFMLKEIHEQPRAIADTLRGRLDARERTTRDLRRVRARRRASMRARRAARLRHLLPRGAGRQVPDRERSRASRARSSWRASSATAIRSSAPATWSSRSRSRGETADTLAAVKEAQRTRRRVLAICNVVDRAIPRSSHGALYTHAGPEIGVASTKCFTTQLAALALLAIYLGRRRGTLTPERAPPSCCTELAGIPHKMARRSSRARRHARVRAGATRTRATSCSSAAALNYPIALEGALKLKEISYIHAEGYAAGEMKHGPIALDRRGRAGGRDRAQGPRLREGAVEPARGARARRPRHRRSRPRATPRSAALARARADDPRRAAPRCSRSSPCCRCSS